MRQRITVFLLLPFSCVLLISGCASGMRPIFEEQRPEIVWPPAPAPARIRYVGQLSAAADLKPPPKPFQRIGEALVGAASPLPLYGPRSAMFIEQSELLWVADPGGRCLHRFDLERRSYAKIERLEESQLLSPVDLCRGPEGSFYVCDSEDVAVHRLSLVDGSLLDRLRLPEEVVRPAALVYDDSAGELLVLDAGAHNIKALGPDGALRGTIGRRGTGPGEFNFPCDLVFDGKMLWVADSGNKRVLGLSRAGAPLVEIGQEGDAPGDLALPKAVAVDSDGHVYVVDARFENVQVFDRQGRLLLAFGQEGTGPGEFWLPGGICIDADDRIWICDSYNGRVQVFDYVKRSPASASDADSDMRRP